MALPLAHTVSTRNLISMDLQIKPNTGSRKQRELLKIGVNRSPANSAIPPVKTSCTAQLVVEEDIGLIPRKKPSGRSLERKPSGEVKLRDADDNNVDPFAFQDYQFLFRGQREEVEPIPLEVVEGQVPVDLQGTYYLQGPGIFSDDHGSQVSPLDGHGYTRKFSLRTGSVEYSAKYVGTEAREEEFDKDSNSWKFTYRGPFSVLKKGTRVGNLKVMKNVANTSIFEWGGKLMCLYEGGQPHQVDPTSLNTIGLVRMCHDEKTFDDVMNYVKFKIRRATEKVWNCALIAYTLKKATIAMAATILQPILIGMFAMPGERMLAHVKIDSQRERLVAITFRPEDMLLPKSSLTIYEFDKDLKLLQRQRFTINDHMMVHDWSLTENHYVIVANRVKLNSFGKLGAAISGVAPMINAIALDDSLPHTPMYLLPRNPREEESGIARNWRSPVKIPKQFWLIHASNAYEEPCSDGRTRVVFEGTASSYQWFNFTHMFGYDWNRMKLDPTVMNDANSTEPIVGKKSAMRLMRVVATLPSSTYDVDAEPDCQFQDFQSCPWSCDFPCVNPALLTLKHQYTYVAATSGVREKLQHFPFDTVAKISSSASSRPVSKWWAGERSFVGEPVFVRKPNSTEPGTAGFVEDDGYLILVQYSAEEQMCYLVILDAQLLGQDSALVARLRVPREYTFPMGFHSFWEETAPLSTRSVV